MEIREKAIICRRERITILHLEIHTYKIIGEEDTWNEKLGNAHCIRWNK